MVVPYHNNNMVPPLRWYHYHTSTGMVPHVWLVWYLPYRDSRHVAVFVHVPTIGRCMQLSRSYWPGVHLFVYVTLLFYGF